MKITLCAVKNSLNVNENLEKIAEVVNQEISDFFIFGEAFLHGFDFLTFEYKNDIERIAQATGKEIAFIKKLAWEKQVAIGFGFYENEKGAIYSSYMVVDKRGKCIFKYKRISSGWCIAEACADYREGVCFDSFDLDGKTFSCFICGDFWEDKLLSPIIEMDAKVDAFLFPVHCDYTIDKWERGEHSEYKKRSAILAKPVFFCNNYMDGKETAKGGAYVWHQGKELHAFEMGNSGLLTFEF